MKINHAVIDDRFIEAFPMKAIGVEIETFFRPVLKTILNISVQEMLAANLAFLIFSCWKSWNERENFYNQSQDMPKSCRSSHKFTVKKEHQQGMVILAEIAVKLSLSPGFQSA